MKKDALALEKRRTIYQYVKRHPGVYMREIQKELGMATGVLEYHLDYLVKEGLLTTHMDGRKKRFYSSEVSAPHKELLSFLRQKQSRRIMVTALQPDGAGLDEMKDACGCSKGTLMVYVNRLLKAGYLEERNGRYFAINPDELTKMLITYRESYLDDVVDRFLDSFGNL